MISPFTRMRLPVGNTNKASWVFLVWQFVLQFTRYRVHNVSVCQGVKGGRNCLNFFDRERGPLSSLCAVTISIEYRPHSHASVCVSVTSPLVSHLSGRQPPLSDAVSVLRFICNRLTQVTNRVLCPTCFRNSSATVSVEWHKAYTVSAIFLHNCIMWGMWPVAYVLYKRLCVSASCETAPSE